MTDKNVSHQNWVGAKSHVSYKQMLKEYQALKNIMPPLKLLGDN